MDKINTALSLFRYLYVCMYVAKNLANCWTDMVLLKMKLPIGPDKVDIYFKGEHIYSPERNGPYKIMMTHPPHK